MRIENELEKAERLITLKIHNGKSIASKQEAVGFGNVLILGISFIVNLVIWKN